MRWVNPISQSEGPSLLRWTLVSPDRFTDLYFKYFTLTDLGIGRILNLAVALPVGYALLTWCWKVARPLGVVFVTLTSHSKGLIVKLITRRRSPNARAGTSPRTPCAMLGCIPIRARSPRRRLAMATTRHSAARGTWWP
jgi:hypothetical protein